MKSVSIAFSNQLNSMVGNNNYSMAILINRSFLTQNINIIMRKDHFRCKLGKRTYYIYTFLHTKLLSITVAPLTHHSMILIGYIPFAMRENLTNDWLSAALTGFLVVPEMRRLLFPIT